MINEAITTVGVDGCKGGWAACWRNGNVLEFQVFKTFEEITVQFPEAIIAVDMPLGLPDQIGAGGRGPETAAREKLKGKSSSVFSMISKRAVMASADYVETCRLARQDSKPPRGISKQGFNILPKVRELDELLTRNTNLRETIYETHPELALAIATGAPVLEKKTQKDGRLKRIEILNALGLPTIEPLPRRSGAKPDDLIDAAICLLVADKIMGKTAQPFPAEPHFDSRGIRMAIWA